MSSLDVVTYFVTRCECVCRVWEAPPAPSLWLLPWVQCHLFLIPLPPLRPPLVPWNTSQFPRFPFSCFANKRDLHFIPHPFPKSLKLTQTLLFLHLHSPAEPPLTNLDLPNLNSPTSTPAGNQVKHHQPELVVWWSTGGTLYLAFEHTCTNTELCRSSGLLGRNRVRLY